MSKVFRVIATDEQGVDVLYRDFIHGVLANDWEDWCRRILPGTTRQEVVERRKRVRPYDKMKVKGTNHG